MKLEVIFRIEEPSQPQIEETSLLNRHLAPLSQTHYHRRPKHSTLLRLEQRSASPPKRRMRWHTRGAAPSHIQPRDALCETVDVHAPRYLLLTIILAICHMPRQIRPVMHAMPPARGPVPLHALLPPAPTCLRCCVLLRRVGYE